MHTTDLTEDQTRKAIIDRALAKAGWDIGNGREVAEEFEIPGAARQRLGQTAPAFNPSGFSDYLLFDRAGDPLAVIEAKRTSRDPLAGQRQAEDYADGIIREKGLEPLIFLTNGYETWYWNRKRYAPEMVHGFFSRADLERLRFQRDHAVDLNSIPINCDIINRDYQAEALKRVFDGINRKRRKFLLVMATGTGKTRTAMALLDVFLRAKHAQRVLFLADREALADQAWGSFRDYLPDESRHWIRSGKVESNHRLYVATIQTMMGCFADITPGFFDIVIADECHRSIYNKWRDVLSYFHAIKIGLTATPSDFIERDTFRFFGCDDKVPTFNYSYEQAVQEGHLVDFRPAYAARTGFQESGIKGGELPEAEKRKLLEQGIDPDNIDFSGSDLEKKVTNAGTNEALVREFMEVSIKDAAGVVPGKSIIFAVTHEHARRLWEVFNRLYPEHAGRLAQIIDSKMERPLDLLKRFRENDYPRVAISVDMLDTGVDVREVVNLVFAKPVFSKIKFWQMIGRGTRILEKDQGLRKPWCTHKDRFLIIDHWNNFRYFGEKPEGEAPAALVPLPERIFRVRLEKLALFAAGKHAARCIAVVGELRADIRALPENSIVVMENRRHVDRTADDGFWTDLDAAAQAFLQEKIAPLFRFQSGIGMAEGSFLLATERLGLAVLANETPAIAELQQGIIEDLKALPRNLGAVRAKARELDRALADEFWAALDYDKCEFLKHEFTELMKYKRTDHPEIVVLDLEDVVADRQWIEFGPAGEGEYVAKYRQQIEAHILALADAHPTLCKIKADQPLTDADLVALEETLSGPRLYITEENLRKVYRRLDGSFIQFVKAVLGKYRFPDPAEQIQAAFDTFVLERNNEQPLTSEQLRFLRAVKNVFAARKHIEYADLFDQPFTQFGSDAALRLFNEAELREIVDLLNRTVA